MMDLKMKTDSRAVVLTLIFTTILYQNMATCELAPLNQAVPIYQRRPVTLLARSISNHLRPIRSSNPPSPAASSTGSANNPHKHSAASASAGAGGTNQLTDLPALVNQEDSGLPLGEDSYDEALEASLAELSDKNRKIATVRLSNPSKLLVVLRQLAKDVAWSIFEQSYRLRNRGQFSEEIMAKSREIIERDAPPFPTVSWSS